MKGKLYQEELFLSYNLSFLFPAVFCSKRKGAKIELMVLSVEKKPFLKDKRKPCLKVLSNGTRGGCE